MRMCYVHILISSGRMREHVTIKYHHRAFPNLGWKCTRTAQVCLVVFVFSRFFCCILKVRFICIFSSLLPFHITIKYIFVEKCVWNNKSGNNDDAERTNFLKYCDTFSQCVWLLCKSEIYSAWICTFNGWMFAFAEKTQNFNSNGHCLVGRINHI